MNKYLVPKRLRIKYFGPVRYYFVLFNLYFESAIVFPLLMDICQTCLVPIYYLLAELSTVVCITLTVHFTKTIVSSVLLANSSIMCVLSSTFSPHCTSCSTTCLCPPHIWPTSTHQIKLAYCVCECVAFQSCDVCACLLFCALNLVECAVQPKYSYYDFLTTLVTVLSKFSYIVALH